MILVHCADGIMRTPSAVAIAHASASAASMRGRHSRSLRSSPTGRRDSAVAVESTASRATFRQSTRFSSSSSSTSMAEARSISAARSSSPADRSFDAIVTTPDARRLHDLHAPDAIGLEPREARRRDSAPEALTDRLHVLEPVQERDDHPVSDDLRIDALQRIAEIWGLHRDQQERHGLHELLDDRRVDVHRLEPVRPRA